MSIKRRAIFRHILVAGALGIALLPWGSVPAQEAVDPLLQEVWLVERHEPQLDLSRFTAAEREMLEAAHAALTEFLRRVNGVFWGATASPLDLLSPEIRELYQTEQDLVKAFVHGEGVSSYRIFGLTVNSRKRQVEFSFFLRQPFEGNDFIEQRGINLVRSPDGRWLVQAL